MTTKPIRIRGFRYAPRVVAVAYLETHLFQVRQYGFWMDACVKGPCKPTSDEAIKAWNRLARNIRNTEAK